MPALIATCPVAPGGANGNIIRQMDVPPDTDRPGARPSCQTPEDLPMAGAPRPGMLAGWTREVLHLSSRDSICFFGSVHLDCAACALWHFVWRTGT